MHCAKHIIDWEGSRVVDREEETNTRQIKEAIHTRQNKLVINRDEGAYCLSRIYDPVVVTVTESSGTFRRLTKSVSR